VKREGEDGKKIKKTAKWGWLEKSRKRGICRKGEATTFEKENKKFYFVEKMGGEETVDRGKKRFCWWSKSRQGHAYRGEKKNEKQQGANRELITRIEAAVVRLLDAQSKRL